MAYLKAMALALLGAVLLGAATAVWGVVEAVFKTLHPGDKATVLSRAIAEGVNCVAFFLLLLVPVAVGITYLRRRKRGVS